MAEADQHSIAELDELVQHWTRYIGQQWPQQCFIFEHGGRTLDGSVGSCIAHAHMQILPLASDPLSDVSDFMEAPTLLTALEYAINSDYMLFKHGGSWQVTKERREKGQFFRRVIADSLGRRDEWDYLSFPNLEAMQETLDRLL